MIDVDEDVFWFQVTVQNTVKMTKNYSRYNLLENITYLGLCEFVIVHVHVPQHGHLEAVSDDVVAELIKEKVFNRCHSLPVFELLQQLHLIHNISLSACPHPLLMNYFDRHCLPRFPISAPAHRRKGAVAN